MGFSLSCCLFCALWLEIEGEGELSLSYCVIRKIQVSRVFCDPFASDFNSPRVLHLWLKRCHVKHNMGPLSDRRFTSTSCCLLLVAVVLCGSFCIQPGECSDSVRFMPEAGNSSAVITSQPSRNCGNETKMQEEVVQQVNGDVVRPSQVRSRQRRYVAFPEGSSFSVRMESDTNMFANIKRNFSYSNIFIFNF